MPGSGEPPGLVDISPTSRPRSKPLPCRAQPGPDRQGTQTLDEPLEARAERLRDHPSKAASSQPRMTNANITYTKTGQSPITYRSQRSPRKKHQPPTVCLAVAVLPVWRSGR